jgi:hypothetical protein
MFKFSLVGCDVIPCLKIHAPLHIFKSNTFLVRVEFSTTCIESDQILICSNLGCRLWCQFIVWIGAFCTSLNWLSSLWEFNSNLLHNMHWIRWNPYLFEYLFQIVMATHCLNWYIITQLQIACASCIQISCTENTEFHGVPIDESQSYTNSIPNVDVSTVQNWICSPSLDRVSHASNKKGVNSSF